MLSARAAKHYAAALCASFILTGCVGDIFGERPGDNAFIDDMRLTPKPFGMGRPDPRAPYEYRKGWNDGCKTGIAASGSGAYKGFYKYTVTMELYSNKKYYRAWKDAFTYCRAYTQRWTLDPLDRVFENYGTICLLCPGN